MGFDDGIADGTVVLGIKLGVSDVGVVVEGAGDVGSLIPKGQITALHSNMNGMIM